MAGGYDRRDPRGRGGRADSYSDDSGFWSASDYGGSGRYGGAAGDSQHDSRDPDRFSAYAEDDGGQDGRAQDGYARPGYAQDGYPQNGYPQDSYGQDGYGQGSRGRDSYPADGYDHSDGGHPDQDGYRGGSYEQYGQDGYSAPYGRGQYGGDEYGPDSYGQAGSYSGRDDYPAGGRAGSRDPGLAQGWDGIGRGDDSAGPDADVTSAYQRPGQYDEPGTGSYGRDGAGRAGYRSAPRSGEVADSGGYDWGSSRGYDDADSGVFRRPDAGSYSHRDSGSFTRRDSGSYGRPDDGPFGREPGADGRSGRYDPDEQNDWDGAEEDDWDDEDAESGLLSRRFGQGGDYGDGGDRTDRGGRGGRGGRKRRGRGRAAFVISMLAVLAILAGGGYFGYKYVHAKIESRYGDYVGAGYGHVTVTVGAGGTLEALGPELVKDGVIMAVRPYDSACSAAKNAANLQPGTYSLHKHMNAALAVQYLLSGKHRALDQFEVLPDARASDIADNIARKTHIAVSKIQALINKPPASLGLPSWAAGHSAEGFLFPDTYTLSPGETASGILKQMVADFNRQTASLSLPSKARKVFTTPYHVLIVASLIQAEGNATDFGKVSRVIWNRLQKNMLLQVDSSVFYAMHKYGTSITKAEERYPSPYNTYLHTGLPPGPIGSPSLAAIQAALHPTTGNWTYFITDVKSKTHRTYFTNSLTQFQNWQREFGS